MNRGMIFYQGFMDAINWLSDEEQLACYKAIINYGLSGEEPDCVGPARAVFESCRAQIDANNRRRENGKKGGEAKANNAKANAGNETAKESEDEANSSKTVANSSKEVAKEKVKDKEKVESINNNTLCRAEPGDAPKTDQVKEVIDYLNTKTGKDFRSGAKANRTIILARFKEGYVLEDFKKIIDNKSSEWMGTEQEQYLRPETLFAPKHFESYLNQKNVQPKSKNQFMQFEQHSYDMADLTKRAKMRSAI